MLVSTQSKALAPHEQCAALEKLFSNLPRQAADKIPYEQLIPGLARQLMLMTPYQPQDLRKKKRLKQLALSIADTVKLIGDLSESDLDGNNYLPVALKELKDDLKAIQTALDFSQKKTMKAKAGRGAPKKLQATKIARAVADHYLGLTGKEPKRNNRNDDAKSPCQELLAAVYEILGVKANAEHYLRAVGKEKAKFSKRTDVERNGKSDKIKQ